MLKTKKYHHQSMEQTRPDTPCCDFCFQYHDVSSKMYLHLSCNLAHVTGIASQLLDLWFGGLENMISVLPFKYLQRRVELRIALLNEMSRIQNRTLSLPGNQTNLPYCRQRSKHKGATTNHSSAYFTNSKAKILRSQFYSTSIIKQEDDFNKFNGPAVWFEICHWNKIRNDLMSQNEQREHKLVRVVTEKIEDCIERHFRQGKGSQPNQLGGVALVKLVCALRVRFSPVANYILNR